MSEKALREGMLRLIVTVERKTGTQSPLGWERRAVVAWMEGLGRHAEARQSVGLAERVAATRQKAETHD